MEIEEPKKEKKVKKKQELKPTGTLLQLILSEGQWYENFSDYHLELDTEKKVKQDFKEIQEKKRRAEELYNELLAQHTRGRF
jgi:hypothetical protein